jgi:5-methylcytosine-specific restriction endonuclease McrA
MMPFDRYPDNGKKLLPVPNRANTRREDAPKLQRLTGQTACAYCGVDLIGEYYRWLLTSLDHVIPTSEGRKLGIPEDWCESFSNTVICCGGCNGFDNRFKITSEGRRSSWKLQQFFALRDRVFADRRERIRERRDDEIRFFETRPWEVGSTSRKR